MYKKTTALKKILAMKARKKGIPGGSSAGKTIAILIILIDKCTKRPCLEVSVVSESIPHLKKGALKDFIKIMKATGRWNDARYNATDRVYRFANGSYMEFFSPEAILGARRHILFINEANNISYEDYHQLQIRTSEEIYIDFNPANEFWYHKEVMPETDCETLKLNYLDNEALPPNVIGDFEQARLKAGKEKKAGVEGYWSNWCKVYIDGELGNLQGAVFNNWSQIAEVPKDAKLIAHGLDWGYSNDPMGCITIWLWNGKLVARENFYKTHMGIGELVAELKKLEKATIYCDPSNPMLIDELVKAGLKAVKGVNEIEFGLLQLQEMEILITSDSLNMIKEFRSYVIDPKTNKPVDIRNHLIDPLRYAFVRKKETQSKPKSYGGRPMNEQRF